MYFDYRCSNQNLKLHVEAKMLDEPVIVEYFLLFIFGANPQHTATDTLINKSKLAFNTGFLCKDVPIGFFFKQKI